MSSLPLGLNRIKIERSLTTSALAVFVPFVTQEVFMGGDACTTASTLFPTT